MGYGPVEDHPRTLAEFEARFRREDGGDDLPGHADAIDDVVSGGLVLRLASLAPFDRLREFRAQSRGSGHSTWRRPAMSEPSAQARRAEGESNGEPPRNRTENPQIKSLLLCQLS